MNQVIEERLVHDHRDNVYIIFEGTKRFFRSNECVEIIVAHHSISGCVELIAYNPEIDQEASRLHLNYNGLLDQLDKVQLENSCLKAIDDNVRIKKDLTNDQIRNIVAAGKISKFILQRILVDPCKDKFGILLENYGDENFYQKLACTPEMNNIEPLNTSHTRVIKSVNFHCVYVVIWLFITGIQY